MYTYIYIDIIIEYKNKYIYIIYVKKILYEIDHKIYPDFFPLDTPVP